jgi:hypothetical protein
MPAVEGEGNIKWVIFLFFSLLYVLVCTMSEDDGIEPRTVATLALAVIFTDRLGNRVVVREGGVTPPAPTPFYSRLPF